MNKFAIEKIIIQGIGGITNLELPFKNGLNLICGTNGIGKTTILECISHAFIRNTTYTLTHFNPTGESDFINKMAEYSQNILFLIPNALLNIKILQLSQEIQIKAFHKLRLRHILVFLLMISKIGLFKDICGLHIKML